MLKIIGHACLFILVFIVGFCTSQVLKEEKSLAEDVSSFCVDTAKQNAFYIVKNNTGYCFTKGKEYPHRLKGGILVTP